MNKQDELLCAMSDEATLNLLYDLWRIVKNTPTRAAEIIVQFKDVSASARIMISDMQEMISRMDSLRNKIPDVKDVLSLMREANREMALTDDKTLNRINRIIDVAEKLKDLKSSGAIDLLKSFK